MIMEKEEPRIGVYICHCGLNIAATVNVEEVAEYAKTLPNVVVAKHYVFMCSEPGQEMIIEDIKNHNLNRVVVAACSPSMHEPTFRSALERAGLNKYLLEMVNVREHCSWVHQDKEKATEKAKDLVRMGVAKARLLEPLEEKEFEARPSVIVVGGGVAGMRSAIELASFGFNVYLVEKSPTLGGKAALIGYVDGRRGPDIVQKMFGLISKNPRIQVFTKAKLEDLSGFAGNYVAKIKINPRYVNEKCTLCGQCEKACPVEVPNEFDFGLTKRKAIFIPFKGAYPPYYTIDEENCTWCGKCVEACPYDAINLEDKPSEMEVEAGAVVLAAGYDPYEPQVGEFGYGKSKNIITLFQLERMLDPEGPTKGEVVVNNTKPKTVVFILCVGSRGNGPNAKPYCSRMCCSSSILNAIKLKEQSPETDVYILYKDIMTYSTYEHLYAEAGKRFIKFLRFEDPPEVIVENGNLFVDVYETTIQELIRIPSDLVVLANGMVPRKDLDELTEVVRASCGGDGFLRELHLKLAPLESSSKGIYLAGTVTGPKNIIESIKMGAGAAAKVASLLLKGKVIAEPMIAHVDEDKCSGCGICVGVCPYDAISIREVDGDRLAHVEEALCMGCGACNAACPSGAMQHLGFKDVQIKAQIDALTGGVA